MQSVECYDIYIYIYNQVELDPYAPYIVSKEVLYADDTALLSSSQLCFQVHQIILKRCWMQAIVSEGAKYGLEFKWTKTYQMNINSNDAILPPDAVTLETKRSMVDVGALITCDGESDTELRR